MSDYDPFVGYNPCLNTWNPIFNMVKSEYLPKSSIISIISAYAPFVGSDYKWSDYVILYHWAHRYNPMKYCFMTPMEYYFPYIFQPRGIKTLVSHDYLHYIYRESEFADKQLLSVKDTDDISKMPHHLSNMDGDTIYHTFGLLRLGTCIHNMFVAIDERKKKNMKG